MSTHGDGDDTQTSPKHSLNWVYRLKKRPLTGELLTRGIPPKGSVQEMRAKLCEYLSTHETHTSTRDIHSSTRHQPEPRNPAVTPSQHHDRPQVPRAMPHTTAGQTCDLVRKWGLKFDGVEGVVGFIERLSELRTAYGFSEESLLVAIPELLKGKALLWYRNNKQDWATWDDFIADLRTTFLPPDYLSILEDDIRKRTQGHDESITDFAIALRTEMRRHGGFSNQKQIDFIYKNLRPEYKSYIRRRDFTSLHDLLQLGTEYEYNCREAKSFRPPPNPAQSRFTDTAYRPRAYRLPPDRLHRPPVVAAAQQEPVPRPSQQPADKCWNCLKTGHRYSACRAPRSLFCYRCGDKGETVKTCKKCSAGNATRV